MGVWLTTSMQQVAELKLEPLTEPNTQQQAVIEKFFEDFKGLF